MKQEEIKVLSTTEHEIFKKLEGNRPYNKGLLNALEESMLNDGDYLRYNPILVNEKMEVIDGQHRLKKAKDLNKPIYYIIAKGFGLKQAQILNSRKRDWKAIDYLNAFIAQHDPEAKILKEFCDEYRLSISIGVKLLSKIPGNEAMKKFREGKFVVKDLTWAQDAAGILLTIRRHSPDYAFARSACISAVFQMMNKLPTPRLFEEQLEKYQVTVTQRASAKEFLNQFQLILDMGGESKYRLI